MKIDVTQQLTELDGEPLLEPVAVCQQCGQMTGGKPVTLRSVATRALMMQAQGGKNPPAEDKVARYHLAMRIHGEDSPDLSPEEIVLVRQQVGEQYQPLVVGQVWEMLDPD